MDFAPCADIYRDAFFRHTALRTGGIGPDSWLRSGLYGFSDRCFH